MTKAALAFTVLALLLAPALPGATHGGGLSTAWRIYSAAIYYDNGSHALMPANTRQLLISGSSWTFGSSHGTMRISPISAADWKRWGIQSYGPKRKATFLGWNGSKADGPIEESSRVDFVWVIYRAAPPIVHARGTVWLKFGRLR